MKSMNQVISKLTISLLLFSVLAPLSLSAEEMILGKSYSVSPGAEPGTFVCKWGDETVNWKPQPWHNVDYKTLGAQYL